MMMKNSDWGCRTKIILYTSNKDSELNQFTIHDAQFTMKVDFL